MLHCFNIPPRSRRFVARDSEMAAVRRFFESGGSKSLVLTGPDGVGKSRLAVEYCHLHQGDYPGGIFWIVATSGDAIAAELAVRAKEIGWCSGDGIVVGEAVDSFRRQLGQKDDWLLVFDQVETLGALLPFLPSPCGGHVLMTTDADEEIADFQAMVVPVLPREGAGELLARYADPGAREPSALAELAAELDGRPLTLELAGAYLQQVGCPVEDYLSSYRAELRRTVAHQAGRGAKSVGDQTVAAACRLSLEALEKMNPAAAGCLYGCAWMATPEGIPIEILPVPEHPKPTLWQRARRFGQRLSGSSSDDMKGPVEVLAGFALVSWDPDCGLVSVHPLVRQVMRDELSRNHRALEMLEETHRALARGIFYPVDSLPRDEQMSRLLPHVLAEAEVCSNLASPESMAHWPVVPWFRASHRLMECGRFGAMRELNANVHSYCSRVLGDEHENTLGSLNNLAIALSGLGELERARDVFAESLELGRRILGAEHSETVGTMANLAQTLARLGDGEAARELWESVVAIQRHSLDEDDPALLQSTKKLAEISGQLEDWPRVLALHEERMTVLRRALGPDHPEVLATMGDLAVTLDALGRPMDARPFHQAVLAGHRRVGGGARSTWLHSLHNYLCHQDDSSDLEVDEGLRAELLEAVQQLPTGTLIREIVCMRWGAGTALA